MDDWTQKVDFMRARGITRAAWHQDGSLSSAELAPLQEPAQDETAQHSTPEQIELEAREMRKKVRFAAVASLRHRAITED